MYFQRWNSSGINANSGINIFLVIHIAQQFHQSGHPGEYQQGKDLNKDLGGFQVELNKQIEKVKELDAAQEALQDELEQQEEQLQKISSVQSSFDVNDTLNQADKRAQQAGSEFDFSSDLEFAQESLGKITVHIEQSVMQHNQHCKSYDVIVYESDYYADQQVRAVYGSHQQPVCVQQMPHKQTQR